MAERKLRIGYIGNGKSVNRYHIPFVLTRKNTMEIKMIYTMNRALDVWADVDGVEYVEDLNLLLNHPGIDVIVVNTPPAFHFEYAKKVLEAGKNCVVEKPFVDTVEQAKELFELAEKKNLVIQSYQNRRFDSDFLTAKKVIESGKLGMIYELETHYDYYRPEVSKGFDPNKFEQNKISHSALYGFGCHQLDQIISLFGLPERVHYDVRQLLGDRNANDYFDIDMYFGNMKATVSSSYMRANTRPKFVIYGDKGMFVKVTEDRQEADLKKFYMPSNKDFGLDTPAEYGMITYYDEDGYHQEKVVSEKGDYALFYDALYETLIHGKEPLVKPEQTICLVEMLVEGVKNLK